MIDERILKSLTSTFDDPSFSVLITKFSQNNECNKDEITISLEQTNPNLYKLIQTKEYIIDQLMDLLDSNHIPIPNDIKNRNKQHINSIVKKSITLDSRIAVAADNNFKSEIDGFVDIIGYEDTPSQEVEGVTKNGILNLTAKGYPIYLPIDRFKVRKNYLYITLPKNIKDLIVSIDNQVKEYTIEDGVLSVYYKNLTTGEHTINVKYVIDSDITSKNVEVVVTPINKSIEIEFNTPRNQIPSVILTVDKKDTNLYSTYTTEFNIDEDTNQYTGMTIEFKNLRRKASYPNINICILGE